MFRDFCVLRGGVFYIHARLCFVLFYFENTLGTLKLVEKFLIAEFYESKIEHKNYTFISWVLGSYFFNSQKRLKLKNDQKLRTI